MLGRKAPGRNSPVHSPNPGTSLPFSFQRPKIHLDIITFVCNFTCDSTGSGEPKLNLKATHLAWLATSLLLSACDTTQSSHVQIRPVLATVSNVSGKTISSITYQPCGASADAWSPVSVGSIPSGGEASFDIPDACVNLQAFYADGRQAGSQTGVRRDFPLSWVIR